MEINLLNWKKETVGNVLLADEVFCQKLSLPLINEVVRWQRASRRSGTHQAKTRGEVRGGGKKPFRQKGTGNARQGSIRSSLNVGGGVTFGPRPRSYKYSLPSRLHKIGLSHTLSYLYEQKKIFVIDDMRSQTGKTKELAQRLKTLGIQKAILADTEKDSLLLRACANLKFFQFLPVYALNVYDLLKYDCLVISKKGIEFLSSKKPPVRQRSKS